MHVFSTRLPSSQRQHPRGRRPMLRQHSSSTPIGRTWPCQNPTGHIYSRRQNQVSISSASSPPLILSRKTKDSRASHRSFSQSPSSDKPKIQGVGWAGRTKGKEGQEKTHRYLIIL
jgi:hypothetical protein